MEPYASYYTNLHKHISSVLQTKYEVAAEICQGTDKIFLRYTCKHDGYPASEFKDLPHNFQLPHKFTLQIIGKFTCQLKTICYKS